MPSELRKIILTAGEAFVRRIVLVRGVVRVALVGSVTTDKPNPKDIDFLLTVSDDFDIAAAEPQSSFCPPDGKAEPFRTSGAAEPRKTVVSGSNYLREKLSSSR